MPDSKSRILTYLPAAVVQYGSMGLCVEYYVLHPQTLKMVRKRVRLQRIVKRMRTAHERRVFALGVAEDINKRLRSGWTPITESEDARLFTPLGVMAEEFLRSKRLEGARERTLECYASFVRRFIGWAEASGLGRGCSGTFLRADAVRYMDAVLARGNSNRSYNNTVKFMRCFFQWGVEHLYCRENAFAGMRLLKKEAKRRVLIDAESRRRIAEYFDGCCPQMGTVARLVYSSALRPKEIAGLRVRDVDLARHCIYVTPENAKNGHARCATLSAELTERLRCVVEGCCSEWFLFGRGKEVMPGAVGVSHSYFGKLWLRMRNALGLPEGMQLYSLRDTGLVDLLHAGVDQLTVRQHADHSSLAMQDIYTSHYDPELNRKIFEAAPEF